MKTQNMTPEDATRILELTKSANPFVDQILGGAKDAWNYLPNKADSLAAKHLFTGGTSKSVLDGASEAFKDSTTTMNTGKLVANLFDSVGGESGALPQIMKDLTNRGVNMEQLDVKQALNSMWDGVAPESEELKHYIHDLVRKTGLAANGAVMGSNGKRSLVNNVARLAQGGLLLGGGHALYKNHLRNRRDKELEDLRAEYRAKSAADDSYTYVPEALRAIGGNTVEAISNAGRGLSDKIKGLVRDTPGVSEFGDAIDKAKDSLLGQPMDSFVNDGPNVSSMSPLAMSLLAGTGILSTYAGGKALDTFLRKRQKEKYKRYEHEAKQQLFDAMRMKSASGDMAKSAERMGSPMVNALIALSLLTGGAGYMGGRAWGKKLRGQREKTFDKAFRNLRPNRALEFLPALDHSEIPVEDNTSAARLLPIPKPGAELEQPEERKRLMMPKLAGTTARMVEILVTDEMVKQAAGNGLMSTITGGLQHMGDAINENGYFGAESLTPANIAKSWKGVADKGRAGLQNTGEAINERGYFGSKDLTPDNIAKVWGGVAQDGKDWAIGKATDAVKGNPKLVRYGLDKIVDDPDSFLGRNALAIARKSHPDWFNGGAREEFVKTAYGFARKHPLIAKSLLAGANGLVGGVKSILAFMNKHKVPMTTGALDKVNNFQRKLNGRSNDAGRLISAAKPLQLQAPSVRRLDPVRSGGIAAA